MRTAVGQVQLRICYLLYFFQDLKTIEIKVILKRTTPKTDRQGATCSCQVKNKHHQSIRPNIKILGPDTYKFEAIVITVVVECFGGKVSLIRGPNLKYLL